MCQKTRKSFVGRFRITPNGKVLRRKAGHRHLLRNKSAVRKRKMSQASSLGAGQCRHVRAGLPFGS